MLTFIGTSIGAFHAHPAVLGGCLQQRVANCYMQAVVVFAMWAVLMPWLTMKAIHSSILHATKEAAAGACVAGARSAVDTACAGTKHHACSSAPATETAQATACEEQFAAAIITPLINDVGGSDLSSTHSSPVFQNHNSTDGTCMNATSAGSSVVYTVGETCSQCAGAFEEHPQQWLNVAESCQECGSVRGAQQGLNIQPTAAPLHQLAPKAELHSSSADCTNHRTPVLWKSAAAVLCNHAAFLCSHAAWLCDSWWPRTRLHSSWRHAAEGRQTNEAMLYQPAFPRAQVVAKLHVDAGVQALPAGLAMHLQHGCTHSEAPQWQVLSVAAQDGCILLSIDIAPRGQTPRPLPLQPQQHPHDWPQPVQGRQQQQQQHDRQHQQQLMQQQDWLGNEQPQSGQEQQQEQEFGQGWAHSRQPSHSNRGMRTEAHNQQHDHMTCSILHALQPILRQLDGGGSVMGMEGNDGPMLQDGLRVTVQADDHVYEAVWDVGQRCWDVQLVGSCKPQPATCLGLAHMLTHPSPNPVPNPNPSHPAPATVSGTGSSNQEAASTSPSLTCSLQVQVWDLPESADPIAGWQPARSKHQTQSTHDKHMRLMAHTEGTYLPVCVEHVLSELHEHSTLPTLLSVMLELPTSQLVRHHHPPGPVTGLQPLVLELWAGEHLLHATSMLLQLLPHDAIDLHSEPSQHRSTAQHDDIVQHSEYWWWGADPSAVHHAVEELQAAQQQLLAKGPALTLPEVQAHQALQVDVCVWLQGVRQAAGQYGYCPAARATATSTTVGFQDSPSHGASTLLAPAPPSPSVSLSLMQHTGQCLRRHAESHRMTGICSMLEQQMQQVVLPAQLHEQQALLAPRQQRSSLWQSSTAAPAIGEQLRLLLLGFPCAQCEMHYKNRLSHQLSGLQFIGACTHTAGIAITVVQQYNRLDAGVWWMLVALWAANVGVVWQHLQMPGRCSKLIMLTWAIRMTSAWPMIHQLIPDTLTAAQSRRVLCYIIGSISDQLPAVVFLPAFITMTLSVLDMSAWCWLLWHDRSTCLRDWGLMACGMAGLWWLQLQLRRVLQPGGHHNQVLSARQRAQGGAGSAAIKKRV